MLSLSNGWEKASEKYSYLSVDPTTCWKNKNRSLCSLVDEYILSGQDKPPRACCSSFLAEGYPSSFILAGRTRALFHENMNTVSPSATLSTTLTDQSLLACTQPPLFVKRETRRQEHKCSHVFRPWTTGLVLSRYFEE